MPSPYSALAVEKINYYRVKPKVKLQPREIFTLKIIYLKANGMLRRYLRLEILQRSIFLKMDIELKTINRKGRLRI